MAALRCLWSRLSGSYQEAEIEEEEEHLSIAQIREEERRANRVYNSNTGIEPKGEAVKVPTGKPHKKKKETEAPGRGST